MQPVDEELAYVVTAKMFALTVYHLLKNNAEKARALIAGFDPKFTRDSYRQYMDSVSKTETLDMQPMPSQK